MQLRTQTFSSRRNRQTRAGVRGFAMIDVITGAAILGIVVVGTMYFFSYGQRQIQARARERAAYDHARNRIEEIVAAGYTKALDRVDSGLTVYGGVAAVRTTTVSYVDDPADSLGALDEDGNLDYKDIQIEVKYLNKTVTLQAFMYP